MVWCGSTKEKVVGPETADSYKFALSREFFPALRRLEREYVFQEDGAGLHRESSVRAYLDRKCDDYIWPDRLSSSISWLVPFWLFWGIHQSKSMQTNQLSKYFDSTVFEDSYFWLVNTYLISSKL